MTPTGKLILERMTARQRETLMLICTGLTNRQMAKTMGIPEQVVKNYVLKVMRKTHRKTRTELAIFSFYHGMVECPCKASEAVHR